MYCLRWLHWTITRPCVGANESFTLWSLAGLLDIGRLRRPHMGWVTYCLPYCLPMSTPGIRYDKIMFFSSLFNGGIPGSGRGSGPSDPGELDLMTQVAMGIGSRVLPQDWQISWHLGCKQWHKDAVPAASHATPRRCVFLTGNPKRQCSTERSLPTSVIVCCGYNLLR